MPLSRGYDMKVSEITTTDIKEYLRLDDDEPLLTTLLASVKAYIKGYTGLDDTGLDDYPDLIPVVYVLVAEHYENRVYTVEKDKVNRLIKSTLDMYCINLL